MQLRKFFPVFAVAALAACAEDNTGGTPTNPGPQAYYRVVNAIPDTSALDIRFIDQVEQPVPNLPFRGFTAYQSTAPGARQLRAFLNPDPARPTGALGLTGRPDSIAATIIVEGTVNMVAGSYYTIVLHGRTQTGQTPAAAVQTYLDDAPAAASLDTGSIALRTIHVAQSVGPVDIYISPEGGASYAAPNVTLTNVPYLTASTWRTVPRRPATPATSSYEWEVVPTGTTPVTPTIDFTVAGTAQVGVVGTTTVNPNAGVQVGRSVLTAIVFGPTFSPRAGTGAAAAALAAPTIRVLPDRDPPRTAP